MKNLKKDFDLYTSESYLRIKTGDHHTPDTSTLFVFPLPNKILHGLKFLKQ